MTLNEAIDLIEKADLSDKPQRWVDLGCGSGLFTEALASLLPRASKVTGVDKTRQSLKAAAGNGVPLAFYQADFQRDSLPFSSLDGIMMANALHFIADKQALVDKLTACLRPDGVFLIVEYDTDTPNPWVPHPISYEDLAILFRGCGFSEIRKTGERQSIYGGRKMYGCIIARSLSEK